MECLPGERKIDIDFNDLIIRSGNPGPQLLSEIEGHLLIKINDEVFFDESDILLLELAKELSDWISLGDGDFLYYSMDYEDGPVLSFQEKQNGWSLSSIWCDEFIDGINYIDFVKQSEFFISNLIAELKKVNIDCYEFLT